MTHIKKIINKLSQIKTAKINIILFKSNNLVKINKIKIFNIFNRSYKMKKNKKNKKYKKKLILNKYNLIMI